MRSLGQYVLQGYKQAALVALICTLLPMMVTPLGNLFTWLAQAVIALVTLRYGAKQGLGVLLWVVIPSIALAVKGNPAFLIHSFCFASLVIWVLAVVLHYTASWRHTLYVACGLGIIAVLAAHLLFPDLSSKWEIVLSAYLQQMNEQFQLQWQIPDIKHAASWLAPAITGLQAAAILANNLFNLLFARWWQALLFNPGGFRYEFYRLRLDYLALGLLGFTLLSVMLKFKLALDILPVILLPFSLAGISFFHSLIALKTKPAWLCLSIFYVGSVLLFPYSLGVLILIACIDVPANFRQRWLAANSVSRK